jgi:hypothetical protein
MAYQCINLTKKTSIVVSKTNLTRRLLLHQKNQTHPKMLERTTSNHKIKNYNKKKTNTPLLFKHSKNISILVNINTNQMTIKINSNRPHGLHF